jgi:predicted HD phosphohydrolase
VSPVVRIEPVGLDEVIELFVTKGLDPYGEDVTQLEHACQSAALAIERELDDALVAACLLHDLGHLMTVPPDGAGVDLELEDDHHESLGARVLARLFGPQVAGPVALHVTAKRWRCATDPGYHATLSSASKATLVAQGGPLDDEAARRFEQHSSFEAAVALRSIDDEAKVPGRAVPGIESYRGLLASLLMR